MIEKGIPLFSALEDVIEYNNMTQLIRHRILQSFFMIIVSSSQSLHLPIDDTEIQSFPWLSERINSNNNNNHHHHSNSKLISWSELVIQIVSGELIHSSIEGSLITDLRKVISSKLYFFPLLSSGL